jgi:hypothetical protein
MLAADANGQAQISPFLTGRRLRVAENGGLLASQRVSMQFFQNVEKYA